MHKMLHNAAQGCLQCEVQCRYGSGREYWIVDPRRRTITVNFFEQNILNIQYSFDATIKVNIYDDLYIDFS